MAAIYSDYRNPLAHAWAVSTKEVGKHPTKRVIMDGSAKVLGVAKQALTEEAVAELEAPTGRAPSWLTPVVVRNAAGGFDLYPHSLYWGTRRMVEKLTRDRARMRQTVALFTTMRTLRSPESVRPGVAQLPDLTSLRHAPQALNLPQPSVDLVPTRENAAHHFFISTLARR